MNAEIPLCRICRLRPADSDEHFIPKATGNRQVVRLLVQEPDGSQKERRYKGGFFTPVLCSVCNGGPASTYAQAYTDIFNQLSRAPKITDSVGRILFRAKRVFLQRFVKQCVLAYICAAPWTPHPVWQHLQDCLLNPEQPVPPSAPRPYLYFNVSPFGRIVPSCSMVEFAHHRSVIFSELSWPPLGVILAYSPHPLFEAMPDVSEWGARSYKARETVTLALPRLRVNTVYPLAFGSTRQIDAWQAKSVPGYLHYVPPGSTSPFNLSALVRRA
jgi:hypothetical protein